LGPRPAPVPLPIDPVLPDLVEALRAHPCCVLRAPTGAGKTTRVPPALLDAGLAAEGSVVVLEPRRVAARAAAQRMAEERGGELGGEVGFQVRFERRAGRSTRILVVTEGLLVRRLVDDPLLEGVGLVVLDEFHERSVDCDLALALARRVQREARPDLRIVVMSATLDVQGIARWLGDAPMVASEGRLFPVAVEWAEREDPRPLETRVVDAVGRALERTAGDVLVFLPGVAEIRRARVGLEPLAARRGVLLAELYGELPLAEQARALRRAERRRVVLATNVAETSVTVEGVTAVVDSGLARVKRYDPALGLDRLEQERISRASAEQRAGRAGRTGPGLALRLWTERVQRSLDERNEPEIRRVDLAGAVLALLAFGETDVRVFPWFEPPAPAALERALELLRRLGALDRRGLTQEGRLLARIPAHPRLARLLVRAHELGVLELGALAAALLQERDPFQRAGRGERRGGATIGSDLLERALVLREFEHGGRATSSLGELNAGAARFALRSAASLRTEVERALGPEPGHDGDEGEAFERAVLAAYADRLARRRAPGDARGVMVGGRGVRLARESAVSDAELFCCVELDAGEREALVRQASAVERAWLDPTCMRVEESAGFDAESGRVVARRRTLFEDLVLDEVETGLLDDELAARVLAQAAARDLAHALPLAEPETARFLARLRSLRAWLPELALPAFEEAELVPLLPELARGARSLQELRRRDLVAFLSERLTWEQRRALDQDAPEKLQVPSGSWIRLVYEPCRPPVLAARIQELFGLAETPRIARGRVPVLFHLLAPNHQPQQVTDDLASFWNGAYHQVKSELRRRYPRHAWPDDPWNAPAERRPRRRPR
jgi:ATP-dependent helicase HrpB